MQLFWLIQDVATVKNIRKPGSKCRNHKNIFFVTPLYCPKERAYALIANQIRHLSEECDKPFRCWWSPSLEKEDEYKWGNVSFITFFYGQFFVTPRIENYMSAVHIASSYLFSWDFEKQTDPIKLQARFFITLSDKIQHSGTFILTLLVTLLPNSV